MNANEQILTFILKCSRKDLYLSPPKLNISQQKIYDEMTARLASGEPLQYILGSCDFMGTRLLVNKHVLIPRPETEIMVETAIHFLKGCTGDENNVLDLGTGSGNIAITLAKQCFKVKVVSIDISAETLDVARKNAQLNGVMDRIDFIQKDMLEFLSTTWRRENFFDMIISNPPYIPTDQLKNLPKDVRQEPDLALNGGIDGLDYYRIIVEHAHKFLIGSGRLIMELGDDQFDLVADMIKAKGCFSKPEFILDYVGIKRIIFADKQ
ncbi:MAG: peptide chain release factor N(5)-glutamine methyltransferase [Candidatus Omnitrophica bacterium]|nr:peptide chain release factor N(5)-glutamine methyltransferase [Candidatus Omnitrophota bacterium]